MTLHNDTLSIRRAVADYVTRGIGSVDVFVPGMVRGTSSNPSVTVSFTGVEQETVTLSGGGTTVETGICAANVTVPCTYAADPLSPAALLAAYDVAGSVTGSITVAEIVTASSATQVQIMRQPTVAAAYTTEDGDLHIPVLVDYRAVTDET